MPPSKNICFDELAKYFHLPINQVAKELGVCATILKKICRRNGIPRWPHRKIKSLDKMIANLEVNLSKNPNEREEINHEVELLRKKKTEIMKNPNILVSKNSRNHSKQGLSATMKKTKEQKQQNEVYTVNNSKPKNSHLEMRNIPAMTLIIVGQILFQLLQQLLNNQYLMEIKNIIKTVL